MFLPIAATLLLSLAGSSSCHAGMPQARATAAPANTICPVTGNPVTPGTSTAVKVKGRDYYVCCPDCISKLQTNPDQYLEKDGTPRNARTGKASQGQPMHEGHPH